MPHITIQTIDLIASDLNKDQHGHEIDIKIPNQLTFNPETKKLAKRWSLITAIALAVASVVSVSMID
jgi:hypothetical protein